MSIRMPVPLIRSADAALRRRTTGRWLALLLACGGVTVAAADAGSAAGDYPAGHRPAAVRPGPPARAPFRPIVDMATFMEHVLTPAATVVWRTNGYILDAGGEHDLAPKSDADWETIESGAATLAEATNALMIPQRVRDRAWNGYVVALAALAERAYQAAEAHDLKAISEVSDRLDATCSACHHHSGLE